MPTATAPRFAAGSALPVGLPGGRRSPKGRLRWYLARVPEGQERVMCEKLQRVVSRDLLEDAFFPVKERWMKRAGAWFTTLVPLYQGYVFVATRDAAGLYRALSRLTLPVDLAGDGVRSWVPLSDDAQAWFSSVMDEGRVVRSSTAVIEGGVLRVEAGPLVGQEARVGRIDRHKRRCWVSVGDAGGSFMEVLPLNVPFKS